MLAIKSNIMADNAARHLSGSYDALSTSVERLSSGLRINSSKDDAAGLAVRELMRADIAQMEQGSRNAQDAISMLQTMEGAMASIDGSLIRMKELAEQASTGSYSDAQRTIMNNEFKQMAAEITRVADSTEFNGIKLLASGGSSASIHFGNSSAISINAHNTTAGGLGLGTAAIDGTGCAQTALTTVTSAISTKDSNRAEYGYMMNRLESTVNVIGIQKENLMTSESRISDVDVATEMASMTRNQVLAQAGVSMLSQANSMPQMAMSLLR